MFKRILSAIGYILFFCMMVFLTVFYKQPMFIFVLMLLIVLPPVSYYICRYTFERLLLTLELKPVTAEAQSNVYLHMRLRNNTFFPLADCSIRYSITSAFYPCEKGRELNCPAYSKGVFSFDMPIYFARSGSYQIVVHEISAFDYLHFFSFKRPMELIRELMVTPKETDSVKFEATSYGEGFDEFEETSAKGNVSSNVTDIREYIPGDRLQKVHWKLSARIQKLMVKENEQTASNQFTLLVELYQPEPTSDCLEKALTNCCSMANALIDAQEAFYFTFYCSSKQDFSTFFIRSKEDFRNALAECFYQTTYPVQDLALETQRKAQIFKGILLYATHEGVEDVII